MRLRRALAIAVGFAGLVLGVLVLALAPGAPDDRLPAGGVPAVALVVAIGWSFVGVGSFEMLRRPDARTGALLAAFGLAAVTASLTVSDSSALYLLAVATDSLAIAVFVHLLLSFPDGRLEDRPARLTVVAGYVLAAGLPGAAILLGGDPAEWDCAGCPENPIAIADSPGLAEALSSTVTVGVLALALAVAVIALMSRRWRRASSYQRRALGPPLAAGLAILGLAIVWIAVQAIGVGDRAERVAQLVYLSTFAALPLAFLAGLVRVRFFRTAAVGRLLERLADEPGAGRLDDALAEALGDLTLRIAYWLPEPRVYVDRDGRTIEAPPEGATEITHRGHRVGALVHGADLREEPELVRAVVRAAALALENARLEAELRAQLEALRASRARIVEAADEERRRLGRDLHDGAQQRLVSILLALKLAQERPEGAQPLVDGAVAEAHAAVEELRELASGIHPAALQRGLDAGLESLATRAAVPVELEAHVPERLPVAVETAAYFTVSEALTNVAKYAEATHARVGARRVDGSLVVEVSDDGVGGADASSGSGLRGLEDRVGAVGGTLEVESPPGRGTVVRARIPL